MTLTEIIRHKRAELQQIEADMAGISPQTFAYQRMRAQLDALIEQIHTLEAQRDAEA